jgi:hypothetical protein
MKKSSNKITSNIELIIEELESSIDSKVLSLSKSPEDIKLGYDNAAITAQKNIISENLARFNAITDLYLAIFNGKKRTIETIEEIVGLPFSSPDLDFNLKEKYLAHIKYDYKLFNFRLNIVVKMYDYPDDVEANIAKLVNEALLLIDPTDTDVVDYFNEGTGMFEFTDEDEKEIIEQNTLYADAGAMKEILCTAIFVKALKCVKAIDPDYYFTELPEIPWSILSKIEFDRANIYNDHISLKFDHWIGKGRSSNMSLHDVTVIGLDERQLPLIKVGGKFYRVVAPAVMNLFKGGDRISFAELAKIENREQLIRAVVLDQSSKLGLFEEYHPDMV